MRLGKRPSQKRKSSWPKAGLLAKPQFVSSESIVGQVQADLIASLYAPLLEDRATAVLETYVSDLADYQEALQSATATTTTTTTTTRHGHPDDDSNNDNDNADKQQQQQQHQVQINGDGSIQMDETTTLVPPVKPLFHSQYAVREFRETLEDVSQYFFVHDAWKAAARAARFERLLEERYGVFLPFVKAHPELEVALRRVQFKYQQGYFSPLRQGDPPIPRSTAVIILFMMVRGGMKWEITVLSVLFFLIGVQPWALVAVLAIVQGLVWRRQCTAVHGVAANIPRTVPYYHDLTTDAQKQQALCTVVGEPIPMDDDDDDACAAAGRDYDVLLIGHDIATLYTAALLTRANRRVLVLSDRDDASGCVTLQNVPQALVSRHGLDSIPFDIDNNAWAKISKQQKILAPAMCSDRDAQGGIRFAQVGCPADGYCFEILAIPGVGTERLSDDIPMLVTAQAKEQLMEDAASYLGDGWPGSDGSVGHSTTGAYLKACDQINHDGASLFYLSKVLPDSVNSLRSKSSYGDCAIRYVQSLLNKSFPLNAHARSLVAGLGFKAECLRPNQTSLAAHVTSISAAISGEGMHYPVGGPRALAKALAAVITQGGGRIWTGVKLDEYIFDESILGKTGAGTFVQGQDDFPACPRCVGVRLQDGREIKFAAADRLKSDIPPVIVDNIGFKHAFIDCLPNDIRNKYKVPRGLPALAESRPVFKVCIALDGTPADLNVTGADYYRLPNAARAQDEWNTESGQVRLGDIGWPMESSSETVSTSSTEEAQDDDKAKPLVETVNEESDATAPTTKSMTNNKGRGYHYRYGESWLHVSFPSAKDPSFVDRHGKITTCVVTIEADDDFVQAYDTKPALFVVKPTARDGTKLGRLLDTVQKDVWSIFPQLQGRVLHSEILGVFPRGLSHTPERYAARGLRPQSPYPGLYVGGPDLTVGGSAAAAMVASWLTANAVVGYSYIDLLFLGKNITSDIARFLPEPDEYEQEDLAVPYTPIPYPPAPPSSVGTDDDEESNEEGGGDVVVDGDGGVGVSVAQSLE